MGGNRVPQLSPDGTKLVYMIGGQLFLRELTALEPRELATAGDVRDLLWLTGRFHRSATFPEIATWRIPILGERQSL